MISGAVASEPAAEQAATAFLEQEATATAAEALIAGFLAAAATRPGVLLSPIHAIMAGPSTFARAFEGRSRQPGLGLPRPRGVVAAGEVPNAALAAAPGSLAALALLHAYDGTVSFLRLAGPALEIAKAARSKERKALLTKVGRLGPAALRVPAILRALLAVAGRTEGGLLSEQDLGEVRPESAQPREVVLDGDRSVLVAPWPSPGEPHRPVEIIVAADARGGFGVLGYSPDDEGVAVPELGITLPRDAVVVRRGVTRVAPGEVLPSPSPLGVALASKLPYMAFGVRARLGLAPADLAAIFAAATTGSQSLTTAREKAGGAMSVALVRAPRNLEVQKLSLPQVR